MGAITRTWMMLAYSLDPRLAVAGAMLDADCRWRVWENGATFDRGCRPMYHGCDLRSSAEVLEMEFRTTDPVPQGFYGGWWYFAFPVADVTFLPFPFFVRGDDVSFSLANDFSFVTLPGVASIQQSFTDKASPTTWYLDMRSHLAHHLSLQSKDVGWWGLQRMFLGFYLRTVLRFHYDSLSAVNLAIEDVLRGPQFFAETADMTQRRADLKALTTTEVWTPVAHPPKPRRGWLNRPARALMLLTLNGHLMPFTTRFGTQLTFPATSREDFRLMYGAREITFLNAHRTASYTLRRDRRRFYRETARLIRNTLALRRDYDRIAGQWRSQYATLTGRAFWADKLGL
jgi:galactofuranosylgalactofuranosylrhamnosyl-N-acetylglucosaminyl-diphospho-decaprenol beta-1,5/1,6-galactofuranosyltransferase